MGEAVSGPSLRQVNAAHCCLVAHVEVVLEVVLCEDGPEDVSKGLFGLREFETADVVSDLKGEA